MAESPSRATTLRRLGDEVFDVLVVGAGATGAAVARDAALRGLRVALCDRGDFGGETSSHSSKLIHGGIRYLQHGQLPLVFEALAERRRLMQAAPHLCRPVEFFFPAYRGESPSLAKLTVGVALYDALALWRPPVKSRRLDAAEVYQAAPLLRSAGLSGALGYIDCQTDDTRLVLEHVLDAQAAGAAVATYLDVGPAPPRRGHLHHVDVHDLDADRRLVVRARALVNATGPFSDAFRGAGQALRPTLGVHIVVSAERLPTAGRAYVIRSPRDQRIMFALPDGPRTVVGTTDTDWAPNGHHPQGQRYVRPGDEIRARAQDVAYLLEAANHNFPPARLGPEDVLSTFAGLRPLLASDAATPSASSREHAIWVDAQGVLTVAGGKLTTMRRMAEEAVDRLAELLRDRGFDGALGPCLTRTRPLPGAVPPGSDQSATLAALHELADDVRDHLAASYGARASEVLAVAASLGAEALHRRLVPELPFLVAEVVYAIRHEHAREVEDVLRRRLPVFRQARDQGLRCAPQIADFLQAAHGWNTARRERSLAAYQAAVDASRRWQQEWDAGAAITARSPAPP